MPSSSSPSNLSSLPANQLLPQLFNNVQEPPSASQENTNFDQDQLNKAFKDLCMACRSGDVDTADSLLSIPNLNINLVDEWDYSPLILGSLCGHIKIVQLLLSRGAVCDRDTFQGARCIYGALNDEIRDVLISFDISKKVDMSQPFASHITSLLNPMMQLSNQDIAFHFSHIHGTLARDLRSFRLNRFILAARSPYFQSKLSPGGSWDKKTFIEMPANTNPEAFKIVVDYMYLRTDGLPIDQERTQDELIKFANKMKLDDLSQGIQMIKGITEKKEKAKIKHDVSFKFIEKARKDMEDFCKNDIIKNKITLPISFQDADEEIDFEDIDTQTYLDESVKLKLVQSSAICDIIVSSIDIASGSVVYYPTQKSILARSEYFETMFKSDIFTSSEEELPVYKDHDITLNKEIIDRVLLSPTHIPVIRISTSCSSEDVAEIILSFLYYDNVTHIPLDITIDILFASDELFLERLKTMCAVNITSTFSDPSFSDFKALNEKVGYDAYELIRISWQTRCNKLEQHITKIIAHHLSYIYNDAKEHQLLVNLIEESSERIRERQDTDTIELVDDIRYYLSKKYSINDEFEDFEPIGAQYREADPYYTEPDDIRAYKIGVANFERDIEMIDGFLNELQLNA